MGARALEQGKDRIPLNLNLILLSGKMMSLVVQEHRVQGRRLRPQALSLSAVKKRRRTDEVIPGKRRLASPRKSHQKFKLAYES